MYLFEPMGICINVFVRVCGASVYEWVQVFICLWFAVEWLPRNECFFVCGHVPTCVLDFVSRSIIDRKQHSLPPFANPTCISNCITLVNK